MDGTRRKPVYICFTFFLFNLVLILSEQLWLSVSRSSLSLYCQLSVHNSFSPSIPNLLYLCFSNFLSISFVYLCLSLYITPRTLSICPSLSICRLLGFDPLTRSKNAKLLLPFRIKILNPVSWAFVRVRGKLAVWDWMRTMNNHTWVNGVEAMRSSVMIVLMQRFD